MKRTKHYIYLGAIVGLGLVIRLLFLVTPHMDSDQAVTGLMARHILGGEFPFFFYGQDYCGSIEAYLASTIFFFFGATRFTLNFTVCLESIFFILFIYYLARLIFDRGTGLLSALFTALASYYLMFHSILARAAYIEIPIMGVLLFILAVKIIYGDETSGWFFFLLGFLCGLGIWTHFLIVFYLPPVFLFWFIKDPWFWKRGSLLFLLTGLVLGGLPLWTHNLVHPLVTWHYLFDTSGGGEGIFFSLKDFFLDRFPEALGVKNNDTGRYIIPYFSFPVYILSLVLFSTLLWSGREGFGGLLKFRIQAGSGFHLLLIFLIFFPIIFSLSGFAAGHTSRYLVPIFVVLPILFAVAVRKLKGFSRIAAFLFLSIFLFSNVYGTISRLSLISGKEVSQYKADRESERHLFAFLKGKGLKHLYAPDYWISLRLTFDAQEALIFSQPVGDRYPFYTDLVDRDAGAGFLFRGDNRDFEETLINIGGSFRKSLVDGFSVYYDFSPPPYRFAELDPKHWTIESSNQRSASSAIFDRDLNTSWTTSAPQKPGDFLQIDLGKTVSGMGRITLYFSKVEEIPRAIRLEISEDGRHWKTIRESSGFWGSLFWSGPHPFYRPQDTRIDFIFSPRSGRFLRLTELGKDPQYPWSVSECFLYQAQPTGERKAEKGENWLPSLTQSRAGGIFMSPWTASQLPLDWRANQRGRTLDPDNENLVQMLSGPKFMVEKESASTLIHFFEGHLKQPFQEQEIGGRTVFAFPWLSDRYQPLSPKRWRFQTNCNPGMTHLAVDGKLTTRWTTGRAQAPGDFFQIDLGRVEQIARIRVLVGSSRNDFPRGYIIQSSEDGNIWKPLDVLLSPVSLHWTGETLLKGGADLDFILPPTPMRFLKITQTGRDEVFYWSIHELELYRSIGSR